MIPVTLIAVGTLRENYWKAASSEYIKRLSAFCKLNIVEIDEARIPAKPTKAEILKVLETEGKAILTKIPARSHVSALCAEGTAISSEQLAERLAGIAAQGFGAAFIIGGSHGLSEIVKSKVGAKISMSAMTFPHQLARVMLLEQLYRGFTIGAGIRYHK